MPDVIVKTAKLYADILRNELGEGGGLAYMLRLATANALGDLENGFHDVEVSLIVPESSDNATRIRIDAFASSTPEREANWAELEPKWAIALAGAWKTWVESRPDLKDYIPGVEHVGIWPKMPRGGWYLASKLLGEEHLS